ncbi:MAG: hypothetical protein ABW321_23455 [Polyangiales bacterium]
MTRAVWIGLGVVVVGVVLWVAALQRAPLAGEATSAPPEAPPPIQAGFPVAGGEAPRPVPHAAPSAPQAPANQAPDQQQAAAPQKAPARAEHSTDEPPPPQLEGPVAEMKQRFESEPRQSSASQVESLIQKEFAKSYTPPGLLKSVQCRSTVCRIEVRWRPDRAEGYMGALMYSYTQLELQTLATEPLGEPDADGSRRVDVYMGRQDPIAVRR